MKIAHVLFLIVFLGISTRFIQGHSWVTCTDYRISNANQGYYYDPTACKAYPRNWQSVASVAFGVDMGFNYQSTESQSCRDPLSSDRNTYGYSAYPMATYTPGQQVCLAWPSKNHVAATCTNQYIPDTELKIYATRTGNADPTQSAFKQNQVSDLGGHVNGVIDFKGFQNCTKFCENMDKSLCTGCFNLPSTMSEGLWTFQWYWIFNPGSAPYTTCWEARVSRGSGSGSATTGSNTVTTGSPATTGSATSAAAATSGSATTGPNTVTTGSPATTGSNTATTGSASTTGSGSNTGCETLIITNSPKTIGQNTPFNVTVAYVAQGSRDIIVDLMGGNNWYGKGVTTVASGKGSAIVTVTPQNSPQQSTNYQLHAWDVNQGQAGVNGAWNNAYDHDYKAITVANGVSF